MSTRLPTPGCVPEEATFVAPTGAAVAGAAQTGGEAVWPVVFYGGVTDPAEVGSFEYLGDRGPSAPDWETIELSNEAVFVDDDEVPWLARHLVPAGAVLPDEAVQLARFDYCTAAAVQTLRAGLADLEACEEKATPGRACLVTPMVGVQRLLLEAVEKHAAGLKADWTRERALCAETLFPDYFWSAYDQRGAQRNGWELSEFGDGQICIVACDDDEEREPRWTGEDCNLAADKHVRRVATGEETLPDAAPYVERCRRAVKIADESYAERLKGDAEEAAAAD